MLLLLTVRENLYIGVHSDDAQATALACTYFATRIREQLEQAIARKLSQAELAAALASLITEADRVVLASWGFGGVAVAQLFESEPPPRDLAEP